MYDGILSWYVFPVSRKKIHFTWLPAAPLIRTTIRGTRAIILLCRALGVLPASPLVDEGIMKSTFLHILKISGLGIHLGLDYPMMAMTATRLGMPEEAIDALLMPVQKNTYLKNGHNYQNQRLRIYLPGNGGLLAAVAMMCAGYDGCQTATPGFPHNGNWKVRWEGLSRMP